mmetsp:Transcript_15410/g.36658  ORF Transcript_15410/g.36658 Transcript_15410/m.36658 type:complete len:82 (+) Transcript_15410:988-1233(+)
MMRPSYQSINQSGDCVSLSRSLSAPTAYTHMTDRQVGEKAGKGKTLTIQQAGRQSATPHNIPTPPTHTHADVTYKRRSAHT